VAKLRIMNAGMQECRNAGMQECGNYECRNYGEVGGVPDFRTAKSNQLLTTISQNFRTLPPAFLHSF